MHTTLKNVFNFRDIADASDGVLQRGRIFRSTTPSEATIEDKQYLLEELRIKTIIDLTSLKEANKAIGEKLLRREFVVLSKKDVFDQDKIDQLRSTGNKVLYQLPIMPSRFSFLKRLSNSEKLQLAIWKILRRKERSDRIISTMMINLKLEGLYQFILKDSPRNILRALEICSDPNNYPILIHCTQGKDRTGMLAAMILNCCEVDRQKILEDYIKSEKELEHLRLDPEYMQRNFPSSGIDMSSWMMAPREAFETVMEWIKLNYGELPKYLDWIGFNQTMRWKLKQSLLPRDNIVPIAEER